jgi:TrmH family RNA methyltransferase
MKPALTSLRNPAVKNLVRLRQRRERDTQQRLLIDGARPLRVALSQAIDIEMIYVAEATVSTHADLLQRAETVGIALQPVTREIFHKIGYGDHPDGVLGVAQQPQTCLRRLPGPPCPLYLVAEGLEKPGNLGAMLRAADAVGVSGLIVCDSQTDIWNPNVIRASQGACFTVPLAQASAQTTWHWLRQAAVTMLAATPAACQLYTQVDMRGPSALIVGAEHDGLTSVWQQETLIRIPMHGQMDSLNVAQAASIVLFEALRQRRP